VASHKILVIDDSKVIRMRVREMLPPGNFEVLEAKDGIEGLNLVRQERPNLIMLDFLLPKKSGWEVFQEIQTHSELQTIPLVLMSGRKEEVTEKITEPFEYFSFVEKPFEKKQLVDAIKEAMSKAKNRPVTAPPPVQSSSASADSSGASAAEIAALNEKIAKMQAEIDGLKKQVSQIMAFIKQKLK
jgi:Response regulator containing CheY-like receiver, AAA-type ATPase, and DNA-binding domains